MAGKNPDRAKTRGSPPRSLVIQSLEDGQESLGVAHGELRVTVVVKIPQDHRRLVHISMEFPLHTVGK